MATHTADIDWALGEGEDFGRGRYSRGHSLTFDGGTTVPGSASPHVVGKWAVAALHHAAHEGCFIANSVKTEVIVA